MSRRIDLTGKRFDRLKVIGIYDKSKSGQIRWKCECDCGNIIPVFKNTLLRDNGSIKSCGCVYIEELRKEIGRKKDYLEIVDVKQYGRKGRVVVRCVCGKTKEMKLSQFLNPNKHSCGCIGAKKGEESPNYKHGMSRTRIYNVYQDMYNRCYNPNDISYTNYGGRGITICQEWIGDSGINNFCDWSYANGYDENAKRGECTIDRIKVDEGYSPDNCRWVSMIVQSNNKTNSRYYEIDGVVKTLSEWCRDYGNMSVQSVWRRVEKGMDIKEALTKPKRKNKADMSEEEIKESENRKIEKTRKWREQNRQRIYEKQKAWNLANPEKVKASKRKYEEKKKAEKKCNYEHNCS